MVLWGGSGVQPDDGPVPVLSPTAVRFDAASPVASGPSARRSARLARLSGPSALDRAVQRKTLLLGVGGSSPTACSGGGSPGGARQASGDGEICAKGALCGIILGPVDVQSFSLFLGSAT